MTKNNDDDLAVMIIREQKKSAGASIFRRVARVLKPEPRDGGDRSGYALTRCRLRIG